MACRRFNLTRTGRDSGAFRVAALPLMPEGARAAFRVVAPFDDVKGGARLVHSAGNRQTDAVRANQMHHFNGALRERKRQLAGFFSRKEHGSPGQSDGSKAAK